MHHRASALPTDCFSSLEPLFLRPRKGQSHSPTHRSQQTLTSDTRFSLLSWVKDEDALGERLRTVFSESRQPVAFRPCLTLAQACLRY
jgi:hypothetical protein